MYLSYLEILLYLTDHSNNYHKLYFFLTSSLGCVTNNASKEPESDISKEPENNASKEPEVCSLNADKTEVSLNLCCCFEDCNYLA